MSGGQLVAATIALATFASAGFEPPRLKSGPVPAQPSPVVGWGQVFLEVSIDPAGKVDRVNVLRDTPPFTEVLQRAVGTWQFEPATEERRPIPSRALVAAVYGPAALFDNSTQGTPPRDLAPASEAVPVPTTTALPRYPPTALGNGIVLVEVRVGSDGVVKDASVVTSASGFDDSAIQAAWGWRFRPARRSEGSVVALAYLVFGFRAPVSSAVR